MTYKITGYASTIHRDRHGDIVHPKALHTHNACIPLLLGHDNTARIGTVTTTYTTQLGLIIKATINRNAPRIEKLHKLLYEGRCGLSIGIIARKFEYRGNERHIVDAELVEVSVVHNAANPYCSFAVTQ